MLYERVKAEISRSFIDENAHLQDLITIVALDVGDSHDIGERFKQGKIVSAVAFAELADENPLTCAYTQQKTEPRSSPDMIIVDMFLEEVVDAAHQLSKKPVKIYSWFTSAATSCLWQFGPERLGGKGDQRAKALEESEKSGRSIVEVAEEMFAGCDDSLREIPGLPPMYDYECYPQERPLVGFVGILLMSVMNCIMKSDGLICSTAEVLEPVSFAALREWFNELGKTVHIVGPLIPDSGKSGAIAGETKQSADGNIINDFLDKTLKSHGEKSLLYISFGSIFWSLQPEKIWVFLDAVMERKIPFIMSHASPLAIIPDHVAEKVKEYGDGLLTKWSPQQTILSHPVTAWFVSHCGQNSYIESVNEGVPLICWPYQADQGTNAAHITFGLGIGYELFEVRSDTGLRPIHRLGGRSPLGTVEAVRAESAAVLDQAFGEDGKVKRANVEKLQKAVLSAWDENGPATRALQDLVNSL